jgi:hypothetical protein
VHEGVGERGEVVRGLGIKGEEVPDLPVVAAGGLCVLDEVAVDAGLGVVFDSAKKTLVPVRLSVCSSDLLRVGRSEVKVEVVLRGQAEGVDYAIEEGEERSDVRGLGDLLLLPTGVV